MFSHTEEKAQKKPKSEFPSKLLIKEIKNTELYTFIAEAESSKIQKSYSTNLTQKEDLWPKLTPKNSVNRLISYNLRRIAKLYTFQAEHEKEIYDFINQHPGLIDLVSEAHPQIRNYFPNEKLTLEVVTDYEDPDWKKLVIYIWSNCSDNEASKKLRNFNQNWWLDASGGVGLNLCIDLEFE
ncbi:MAG TPA: hypothetical protein VK184_18990 [Nostocaceae cyanobacterium]|nr:hypothetical protein [Nostocaceae cyanobacterium]